MVIQDRRGSGIIGWMQVRHDGADQAWRWKSHHEEIKPADEKFLDSIYFRWSGFPNAALHEMLRRFRHRTLE
jgi:hypothetical protein